MEHLHGDFSGIVFAAWSGGRSEILEEIIKEYGDALIAGIFGGSAAAVLIYVFHYITSF